MINRYSKQEYWDLRYQANPQAYEWLLDWPKLRQHIAPLITKKPQSKILGLGCGTSDLEFHIALDFPQSTIIGIDYSKPAVELQNTLKASRQYRPSNLRYQVEDCTSLSSKFEGTLFDVVIDKSTLDSLVCGENPQESLSLMLKEVSSHLESDGVYIVISYADPVQRIPYLGQCFRTRHKCIDQKYYIYYCSKQPVTQSEEAKQHSDDEEGEL